MKRILTLATFVVVGTLFAPAVQADEGEPLICHWLDILFRDLPIYCPTPQGPERSLQEASGDDVDPHCLGCGGPPAQPRDLAPSATAAARDGREPKCLSCGGLPTAPANPVTGAAAARGNGVDPHCLGCGGPPAAPKDVGRR